MKMSYNDTFPTVNTMNPPDPNSAPDTVKVFLRMTNERLCEAIQLSEAILEDVGGPTSQKEEQPRDTSSLIAVTGYHVDLADRLCVNLKKIADLIGVYA
jgi:hypothetical protein